MFDAGLSRDGLMHNLDVLELKPGEMHAIALSHGHADHTNGLGGMLRRLGGRRMPLLLHPDALLQRKVVLPDGHEMQLPPPDPRVLRHDGVELVEERGPSYLLGSLVMITGRSIARPISRPAFRPTSRASASNGSPTLISPTTRRWW